MKKFSFYSDLKMLTLLSLILEGVLQLATSLLGVIGKRAKAREILHHFKIYFHLIKHRLHREHCLHIPAHPQGVVKLLQSAAGGPLHLRHGVPPDHDARGHQEPGAGDLSPRDHLLLPPLPSQRHRHDGLNLHDHSHRI